MKIQVLCNYPYVKKYYFMCAEPINAQNIAEIEGRYMWVRDGKEYKRKGKRTIPAFMFSANDMLEIFQTNVGELRQLGYKPCRVSFSHLMTKEQAYTIVTNCEEVSSPLYTAPSTNN